jgi:subtilisin family serine protease
MSSHPPIRRARGAALALSATLVAALGLGALPASAAPSADPSPATPGPVASGQGMNLGTGKLRGLERSASARQSVFVELSGQGAAETFNEARKQGKSETDASQAARGRRDEVGTVASDVVRAAKADDNRAAKLFEVANAVPGVAIQANGEALRDIAQRSDVVKITPLVPKTATNAGAAQLTRVLNTWQDYGNTGKGVRVGVIDTGLDYTHADFGGTGTEAAYQDALANETDANWRGKLPALAQAKVAGGHDFVGDGYDASSDAPASQHVPKPDENPIDCAEHGTHVAGTVAGYGVNKDGSVFTGDYSTLKGGDLEDMKVAPGMAPKAQLYSLKVFGCTGSTEAVIPALDWALDPNGDGKFGDHLDIVNLSLGSDYGTVDDPENDVVNELAANGVLPVISMGNNGDLTDTGGAPGNAVRSLAVASSVDANQLRDGLQVNAPVARISAGQVSVAYDWAAHTTAAGTAVSGKVVTLSDSNNADGCGPLLATDAGLVKGKVAWLEWDDDDAKRRCGSVARSANVKAAGAIGAIFTSSLNVFDAGITGDADIPVFQLSKSETDRLRPALNDGALNVTFDGSLVGTVKDVTPSVADTVSSFTSRGTHGSLGVVKPDVAAPGDTIASAGMGSGNDVLELSGTSMAAPHTAGISALVKSAHPGWTTEQVKAAVMNTAGHDVTTGENGTGVKYGPARVGAGRVDARAAVDTTVLAYSADTPGAVSASFGVVPVTVGTKTVTRKLTVQNTGNQSTTVQLSYDPVVKQPGVSYTVSPASLVVRGRGTAFATVTMTVDTAALRHTIDPTMAKEQIGVARQFVADASGRVLVTPSGKPALRVPVYGAAKPVSQTSSKVTGTAGQRSIMLSGTGVQQGEGSDGWRSLVSVMELGAASGVLPVCTGNADSGCTYNASSRAGDLKYVGAGSNSDWLWFGIATQSDWATVGNSMIPYVDFDTTGDSEPDYEVYVQNYPDTDVLLATTIDLATGDAVDSEPVNFNFGDVDTNVFDNNVLVMPVSKTAIKSKGSVKVGYRAATYDGVMEADLDQTPVLSYDSTKSSVIVGSPLYDDQGNTTIPFQQATTNKGSQALVLHLHGAAGQRAELLSVR